MSGQIQFCPDIKLRNVQNKEKDAPWSPGLGPEGVHKAHSSYLQATSKERHWSRGSVDLELDCMHTIIDWRWTWALI